MIAEGAKKSPELIQLLELHTQFSTITPYSQVSSICGLQYGHLAHKRKEKMRQLPPNLQS